MDSRETPNRGPDADRKPALPSRHSLIQVPIRFAGRLVLMATLALLGNQVYADCLIGLLTLSAAVSVFIAELRSEPVFASELTHWDEAAGYGIAISIISLAQ